LALLPFVPASAMAGGYIPQRAPQESSLAETPAGVKLPTIVDSFE